MHDPSQRLTLPSLLVLLLAHSGCDSTLELGDMGDGGADAPARDGASARDGAKVDAPPFADSSGETGMVVTPAACAVACEMAAVAGCNVDSMIANNECVTFCARSPTSTQLTCLAGTPCATLTSALAADGNLCDIPVKNTLGCVASAEACQCFYDTPPPNAANTAECSASMLPVLDGQAAFCCADIGYMTVAGSSCLCSAADGLTCDSQGMTIVSSCTN